MHIAVQLPEKMGIGIGSHVQCVLKGVVAGWMSLPIDVQKVVTHTNVVYAGSTTLPLPTDVFDIEVKMSVRLDGIETERSASLRINDFRGDVSATTSQSLTEAVMGEIRMLGATDKNVARLLL